LIFDFHFFVLM